MVCACVFGWSRDVGKQSDNIRDIITRQTAHILDSLIN